MTVINGERMGRNLEGIELDEVTANFKFKYCIKREDLVLAQDAASSKD